MLRVAKLHTDSKLPTRKNSTDAGLDLYAYVIDFDHSVDEGDIVFDSVRVEPRGVSVISTGITVEIPSGYFGWITNKSKNDYLVGAGIVDEGYQGELLVKIFNPTTKAIRIDNGQAIAQLLIIPCSILDIEEVPLDEIHKYKTARGITGGILIDHGELLIDDYNYALDDLNYDAERERRSR